MEVEQIELQDKMSENHRNALRSMLGLNELPLPLLKRYFLLKKLYDKIDAFVSVADLVRIALDVGFNPETMRFEKPKWYVAETQLGKPGEGITQEQAEDLVMTTVESFKKNVLTEPDKPEPTNEVAEMKETVEAETETVESLDEIPPVEEPEPEPDKEDSDEPLSLGASVEVLQNGEIVKGVINGSKPGDGDTGIIYSVELDDSEVIEASEDEVQEL